VETGVELSVRSNSQVKEKEPEPYGPGLKNVRIKN
jgi:hypothetical protein